MDKWIIITTEQPIMGVVSITSQNPTEPNLSTNLDLAMGFNTLEDAEAVIITFANPSAFVGHRPVRKPKPKPNA